MAKCTCATVHASLKAALADHVDLLNACRMHYQCAEAKSIISNQIFDRLQLNMSDVSMVQDASGGQGTVYHPQYHYYSGKEFPKRFDLLKVKCTFCKIHGHGTFIYVSFNQIESSGANLSLDTIYSSIFKYLKSKPEGHKIRYYCCRILL